MHKLTPCRPLIMAMRRLRKRITPSYTHIYGYIHVHIHTIYMYYIYVQTQHTCTNTHLVNLLIMAMRGLRQRVTPPSLNRFDILMVMFTF